MCPSCPALQPGHDFGCILAKPRCRLGRRMRCGSGDTERQGRCGDAAGRVGVDEMPLMYLVRSKAFAKRANPRRRNPGLLQDSFPFRCRPSRQLCLDLGHQFAGMRLARRTFGKARIGQPVLTPKCPCQIAKMGFLVHPERDDPCLLYTSDAADE